MLTQRLGSTTQKDPAFIEALIEQIRLHPGSVDEVWFATDYGFPSIENHIRTAETLVPFAEKFRALGVRVSLQLSNSIGHGEYMSSRDCSGLVYEGSPVEHMVGDDGTTARYCFCWNGPHMREYIGAELEAYCSRLKPYRVWVDDDLRTQNHAPVGNGCWCDDCIAKFNARYGSSFTREELVDAVNNGDIIWRERHIEFLRDGLADFAAFLGRSIHAASPETMMGYQHGGVTGYTGWGMDHVYDAMRSSTGYIPASRPGGGAYDDYDANGFLWKQVDLEYQYYTVPDYVTERRPEIESLPDVVFGKSIGGTCFETTLYLAGGANAMSYAMLMNDYEPMSWHGKMLGAFASHRPYWMKLSETSTGTAANGVRMLIPKEGWRTRSGGRFGYTYVPYHELSNMRYIGIPVVFSDDDSLPAMLCREAAERMSEKELETLLSTPVIMSGDTYAVLARRGLKLPASAEYCNTRQLFERYSDHPVNGAATGRKWNGQFNATEGIMLKIADGCENDVEVLSRYATSANGTVTGTGEIASAIIRTPRGAKWGVFGMDFGSRIISSEKRAQYLETIKYISDKKLACEIETPHKAVVFVRTNNEGKTVRVSAVNCTVADCGEISIIIRNPAGKRFVYMDQYRETSVLDAESVDENSVRVVVPGIGGWTVGTVFCE